MAKGCDRKDDSRYEKNRSGGTGDRRHGNTWTFLLFRGGLYPEIKTILPSDGGGIPFKDTIVTSGNSNYSQFKNSPERLNRLKVEC